jgi:hypothetical protein
MVLKPSTPNSAVMTVENSCGATKNQVHAMTAPAVGAAPAREPAGELSEGLGLQTVEPLAP